MARHIWSRVFTPLAPELVSTTPPQARALNSHHLLCSLEFMHLGPRAPQHIQGPLSSRPQWPSTIQGIDLPRESEQDNAHGPSQGIPLGRTLPSLECSGAPPQRSLFRAAGAPPAVFFMVPTAALGSGVQARVGPGGPLRAAGGGLDGLPRAAPSSAPSPTAQRGRTPCHPGGREETLPSTHITIIESLAL